MSAPNEDPRKKHAGSGREPTMQFVVALIELLQHVIFYYAMHPVVYRKCIARVDEMGCLRCFSTQIC